MQAIQRIFCPQTVDEFQNVRRRQAEFRFFATVYPIKVNQQRRVVEEILRAGAGSVGLEAGSKPELLAVIG